MTRLKKADENIVYCICPKCKSVRKKINNKYNIIKRGHERNGSARFLCLNCKKWFNEKTSDSMGWYSR
jgi:transposase-like protein